MGTVLTVSGLKVDPLRPRPEELRIGDIAHALSQLCRANGHFPTFYSVAQHSLACCREAKQRGESERIQLACLLHDGSEAYLSDVTRPVKAALPQYLELEAPLQECIWNTFLGQPLTAEERKTVFEIDDALLYHEFFTHTGYALQETAPRLWSTPSFEFVPFAQVEREFLAAFQALPHFSAP